MADDAGEARAGRAATLKLADVWLPDLWEPDHTPERLTENQCWMVPRERTRSGLPLRIGQLDDGAWLAAIGDRLVVAHPKLPDMNFPDYAVAARVLYALNDALAKIGYRTKPRTPRGNE